MVLKWIQSVVRGNSPEATGQGAHEETKRRRRIEGKDVAHEALMARARQQQAELDGLVRAGTPQVKREQFKSCVRNKVFEIVSNNFKLKSGALLDEITEEITGQIVAAADVDPAYREMFDKEEK